MSVINCKKSSGFILLPCKKLVCLGSKFILHQLQKEPLKCKFYMYSISKCKFFLLWSFIIFMNQLFFFSENSLDYKDWCHSDTPSCLQRNITNITYVVPKNTSRGGPVKIAGRGSAAGERGRPPDGWFDWQVWRSGGSRGFAKRIFLWGEI